MARLRRENFKVGQRVRIKEGVVHFANKLGTVASTGVQLGYPVVRVKFDDRSEPVAFAPEEVKGL